MKLTFVLPLATGRDIELATTILLPSLLYFFNLEDLDKLYIIMKSNDIKLFNLYIQKKKLDIVQLKINIIDEDALIDTTNIYNTYYLQMLLKLLIANKIETSHYITLDADIYFCKKCDSTFFLNYNAFYKKINKIDRWAKRVEKELNVTFPFITNQTPFIFDTKLVKMMLNSIDVNDLILKKRCSEYTLFLGFMLKNNLLEDNYTERNFTNKSITKTTQKSLFVDNEILLIESFLLYEYQVLGCIQSRIIHNIEYYKLIDIMKDHIPILEYKKQKIGLLTVVSDDSYFKKYEKAFYTKYNYCKYNNYDYIFDIIPSNKYPKDKGWLKLYKLREVIELYDYVFTSDADVIITNRDRRISDIILEYSLDDYMMLITTDYNSINTGNIIWRNCPETIKFLDDILSFGDNKERLVLNDPYKIMGIYEQPTIIHFINKYPEIRNKIKIIPQFEMNSYLDITSVLKQPNIIKEIDGNINRCNWAEGDFLIHFSGFNYSNEKGQQLWKKYKVSSLIEKFVILYKLYIIRKEGEDYGNII